MAVTRIYVCPNCHFRTENVSSLTPLKGGCGSCGTKRYRCPQCGGSISSRRSIAVPNTPNIQQNNQNIIQQQIQKQEQLKARQQVIQQRRQVINEIKGSNRILNIKKIT